MNEFCYRNVYEAPCVFKIKFVEMKNNKVSKSVSIEFYNTKKIVHKFFFVKN